MVVGGGSVEGVSVEDEVRRAVVGVNGVVVVVGGLRLLREPGREREWLLDMRAAVRRPGLVVGGARGRARGGGAPGTRGMAGVDEVVVPLGRTMRARRSSCGTRVWVLMWAGRAVS